jgi:hypothetical protein
MVLVGTSTNMVYLLSKQKAWCIRFRTSFCIMLHENYSLRSIIYDVSDQRFELETRCLTCRKRHLLPTGGSSIIDSRKNWIATDQFECFSNQH